MVRVQLRLKQSNLSFGEPGLAWRRVRQHKVASARLRFLSQEESKAVIDAAPADFRAVVVAALTTGCRQGELMRMRVDAFDPRKSQVYVAPGKNGRERWVPLPAEADRLFRTLAAGRPATAPMFLTADKQPFTTSLAGEHMRSIGRALGLGTDVVFHVLRHTCASCLVMAGAPLLAVMKLLGHSNLDMVTRYAPLSPDFLTEAVLDRFPTLRPAQIVDPPQSGPHQRKARDIPSVDPFNPASAAAGSRSK